jgi:MFS family permease
MSLEFSVFFSYMKNLLGIFNRTFDKLVFGFVRLPDHNAPARVKRRSGILASLEEGIFAQIWIIPTSGKFLIDLVLLFGAASIHLGIINAVPFLTAPAQLIGAYLVTLSGSRKRVLLPAVTISRQLWWIVLILVFLPIESGYKLWIFIALYAVMSFTGQISGNAWLSWLGDLLPDNIRGRVISTRNGILIIVGMVADFVFSQIRETLGKGSHNLYLFICLGIASFAGLKTVLAFKNQWEPPFTPSPVPMMKNILKDIFQLKAIRRLIIALMMWNIAIGVATSFWTPHMMLNLKMSFTAIFFYSSVVMIFHFIMSRGIWGPVIDRAGTVAVVSFCALLITFIPLIWLFISADYITPLWFEAVLNGLTWSGFNIAIFNLPFFILPQKNRVYYFAFLSALSGLAMGVGALAGGIIAQILEPMHVEILGMTYINYHVTFLLSAILRGICVFQLRKIPDARSKGMTYMLKVLGEILGRIITNPRLFFLSQVKTAPRGKKPDLPVLPVPRPREAG